jgi:hypothetical protein
MSIFSVKLHKVKIYSLHTISTLVVEIIPGTRETSHKRVNAKNFCVCHPENKSVYMPGHHKRKMGSVVEWLSHTLILRFFAYVKQNPVHHLPYDFNPRGTKPHYVLLAFSVGNNPRPQADVSYTNHALPSLLP